jgi:hypothetical protein
VDRSAHCGGGLTAAFCLCCAPSSGRVRHTHVPCAFPHSLGRILPSASAVRASLQPRPSLSKIASARGLPCGPQHSNEARRNPCRGDCMTHKANSRPAPFVDCQRPPQKCGVGPRGKVWQPVQEDDECHKGQSALRKSAPVRRTVGHDAPAAIAWERCRLAARSVQVTSTQDPEALQ